MINWQGIFIFYPFKLITDWYTLLGKMSIKVTNIK